MKKTAQKPPLRFDKTRLALALAGLGMVAPMAQAVGPIAIGPEFLVNTFTTNNQANAAAAMDADGDFVIVWQSTGQDNPIPAENGAPGIYAQRYNAAGVPQGPEFLVNSETSGYQSSPAVAMDASGNFVVVWQSTQELGFSNYGIYAQRYNAAGAPQGSEFKVNTSGTNNQSDAAVAMDADGDFAVVWATLADGVSQNIAGQRFDAAGAPQGGEFTVNTTTTGNQTSPAIAMDQDGDFVVAWSSPNVVVGGKYDVYARRFTAAGVGGVEFPVNSNAAAPAVAMDQDGDFVVAWHVPYISPITQYATFAKRYSSAGVAQGGVLDVGHGGYPSVAMDPDGDFVVIDQHRVKYGIFTYGPTDLAGIRYSRAGVVISSFGVNTFGTGTQGNSAVAMDADGDFVVAWHSGGYDINDVPVTQDGSAYGVYAQRFDEPAIVNASFAAPTLSGKSTSNEPAPNGEGPAGVHQFTARFCPLPGAGLTNLFSLTKQLSNNNSLLTRTIDAPSGPPGGPGSLQIFEAAGDYNDLQLTSGECADVLYRIGLASKASFTFRVDVYGNVVPPP